jgi:hypothetical protein
MKAHKIPAVKEKPFRKDYIFRKFLINFSTGFLGPRCLGPLPRHIFPKATAVVIEQFRKAAKKLCHFISGFPKPFYG